LYTSAADAIALKVGRSAHRYLQECFYTEVSVLNRDGFDAVPEIVKSDLTIMVSQNPTSNCHFASMHSRLKTLFCRTFFSGILEREATAMSSKLYTQRVNLLKGLAGALSSGARGQRVCAPSRGAGGQHSP
jgi:hypothetical protein